MTLHSTESAPRYRGWRRAAAVGGVVVSAATMSACDQDHATPESRQTQTVVTPTGGETTRPPEVAPVTLESFNQTLIGADKAALEAAVSRGELTILVNGTSESGGLWLVARSDYQTPQGETEHLGVRIEGAANSAMVSVCRSSGNITPDSPDICGQGDAISNDYFLPTLDVETAKRKFNNPKYVLDVLNDVGPEKVATTIIKRDANPPDTATDEWLTILTPADPTEETVVTTEERTRSGRMLNFDKVTKAQPKFDAAVQAAAGAYSHLQLANAS